MCWLVVCCGNDASWWFASVCASLAWWMLVFGVLCVVFVGYWRVVVFVGCLLRWFGSWLFVWLF